METPIRAERALAAVRSLPVFRALDPEAQRRIAALATIKDLQRGDHLWREGDDPESLTIIVKGWVKVVRETGGGAGGGRGSLAALPEWAYFRTTIFLAALRPPACRRYT